RVPTIGKMDEYDVKLVSHRIEPSERGLHCEKKPRLRGALAWEMVQKIGPFDVCVARRGLKRDPEERFETWILRNIFGAIGRTVGFTERQHEIPATPESTLRTYGRDAYARRVSSKRSFRIRPEVG